ncbi:pyridoxamine 5'-phosphate oxidase-domain-containing protein [Hyaloraphidium curvatum]|nr:pyridoxamine 5'-phosphate oxidase-domain-containing protein [Hyaloraphidium curvatum]
MAASSRSWKAMIEYALKISRGKDGSAVYVQLATPTPSVRTVVFRGFLGPIAPTSAVPAPAAADTSPDPSNDPSLPIPSREAPNRGSPTSDMLTFCTDCRSEKVQELIDGNGRAEVCWWLSVPREQYRLSGRIFLVFPPSHPLYASTPLPPIPFPPTTADAPTPSPAEQQQFWEQQRLALWGRIAPGGRASFSWPHPGKPLERSPEDRMIWELDDMVAASEGDARLKEAHDLGLTRFTLLVMEVVNVDYLRLSGRPQTRIKFSRGDGGSWVAQDVNP